MLADAVYTEPIAVTDTFASGLADAEDLGDGNFRLTFFARRRSMDYAGAQDCEIVDRLILPASALILMIKHIMEASGYRCCGGEKLRRLSH